MDVTMPLCNGIDGVKKIIKDFPTAKIIMCSAMGQQIIVLDAIHAGAKDFIVKPFQVDQVLETINKVINNP
jgi:two-component system chemotaxis response regulator CheY